MSGENKNKRNCVEESQEKLIESISKNISKWRKRNELTQAQLAEKLNIETETISRLERGKHLPSLVTLHKIADQFSISIAELLVDPTLVFENDVIIIARMLSELSLEDREFVFKLFEQICTYQKTRKIID